MPNPPIPTPPRMPSMPAMPDVAAIMRKASESLDSAPTAADILDRQKAEPVPDPLADVEYTGDLEEDSARELAALENEGYRSRANRENVRFAEATDSEHWFCVSFRSRAEKDAFLEAFHLTSLGNKYLDGAQVAKRLKR